jgi:hypothetical protein
MRCSPVAMSSKFVHGQPADNDFDRHPDTPIASG